MVSFPVAVPVGPQGLSQRLEDVVNENVRAFLEMVKADPDLSGRLSEMGAETLAAAARERGFDLSAGDFGLPAGEMSDSELENVAGGSCFCFTGGGGHGQDPQDGDAYFCICAVYGQGGDGRVSDANCCCPVWGGGSGDQQWMGPKEGTSDGQSS